MFVFVLVFICKQVVIGRRGFLLLQAEKQAKLEQERRQREEQERRHKEEQERKQREEDERKHREELEQRRREELERKQRDEREAEHAEQRQRRKIVEESQNEASRIKIDARMQLQPVQQVNPSHVNSVLSIHPAGTEGSEFLEEIEE
jgi:hypothetical protein